MNGNSKAQHAWCAPLLVRFHTVSRKGVLVANSPFDPRTMQFDFSLRIKNLRNPLDDEEVPLPSGKWNPIPGKAELGFASFEAKSPLRESHFRTVSALWRSDGEILVDFELSKNGKNRDIDKHKHETPYELTLMVRDGDHRLFEFSTGSICIMKRRGKQRKEAAHEEFGMFKESRQKRLKEFKEGNKVDHQALYDSAPPKSGASQAKSPKHQMNGAPKCQQENLPQNLQKDDFLKQNVLFSETPEEESNAEEINPDGEMNEGCIMNAQSEKRARMEESLEGFEQHKKFKVEPSQNMEDPNFTSEELFFVKNLKFPL